MKSTVKQQLDIIAGRLWDGHASLFVGAGFSKNATLLSGGKIPPDWNELGDLFFEKARTHKPTPKEREYANVLRLAEEVECVYGRKALFNMIQESINDNYLEPSDLHMQLLSLPWRDVFTTNYDTLLERAAIKLKEQRKKVYSIISSNQEIGFSTPPFLMKLHGDIKVPDSIVITEEDYRKYPSSNQAKINHIQHTIMMETLVLIGFSGNDPNFIQWIGWVKDALSNNQRKVYLLTVDVVSESMVRTFEKKNIIIVDLKDFAGQGAKTKDNIAAAIQYFDEYHTERINEGRIYKKQVQEWGSTTVRDEDLLKTYKRWKEERSSYPGWLVMPRDKREMWAIDGGFTLPVNKVKQLYSPYDILYLDLFNWRIEKSLFPIDNDWESIYLDVLTKYAPFEQNTSKAVKDAWINLKLGLLRLYRQERWTEKWISLNNELSSIQGFLKTEQRCRFSFEQAMMSIYQSDFNLLKEILVKWPKQRKDPYWDVRKGALWAEYLSLEAGKKITKKAIDTIIIKLDTSKSEKERYYWGSRKVHALTVWNCMAQANFSMNTTVRKEAHNTWVELRPYDDIWYEREFFDANLRPIEQVAKERTKEPSFYLGQTRTTTYWGGNAKDYRIVYAFFLYYEETAFPIHLPYLNSIDKSTLEKALSVMSYCSPAIAETWLLRSGDPKLVSAVFNRRYLDRTPYDTVCQIYDKYLDYFDSLINKERTNPVPSWILVYRNILPEILSRLCMKASYEARVKTFVLMNKVFGSDGSIHYEGMNSLLYSLITSLSHDQTTNLIPMLLQMNIAYDNFGDYRLEPLSYLDDPEQYTITIEHDIIRSLFERVGKDNYTDRILVYRLLFLQRLGFLNSKEEDKLTNLLWANRDQYGFPSETPFAKFAFLAFPHPKDVEPQLLLKEYISKNKLPKMSKGSVVSFYGGNLPILNDIKGTTNSRVGFVWDSTLLNTVCDDIIEFWESGKKRIKENERALGFSVKDELKSRIFEIETVLSGVVASNLELVNGGNRKALATLINELEEYGIPALRVKVALSDLMIIPVDLEKEIPLRLGSSNEQVVDDAIKTIIFLEKNRQDVHKWVELLSEYFRGYSIQGNLYYVIGLDYFTEKSDYLESPTVRLNIIIGLERLFYNTQISVTDSELEANDKMNQRKMVASIIRRLANRTDGPKDEVINMCKTYYESDNTCWDVKNKYID